jgi:ATP-dependent DNA helicase 2 subunit 1
LCRFKKNSIPEFAILIPQEEVLIDGGGQDMPPGFHVVPQPYVDDIRAPPKNITDNLVGEYVFLSSKAELTTSVTANERQSKLMGNIVKRLRSKAAKYRSEVYPNPGQWPALPKL